MITMGDFLEKYSDIGTAKTQTPALKLLLLGIMSGYFIGMGGVVTNTVACAISNPSIAKLLCGLLFPFGLIMVIMTSSELFTGNCLITISVITGKATLPGMLRNLILVYIGNFIGACSLAAAVVFVGQMDFGGGALGAYAIKIAAGKCSLSFVNALILGILCNILVCVAVIGSTCAVNAGGKAAYAFFPISFFVIAGFEHTVANMFFCPAGIFAAGVAKCAELAAASGVDVSAVTWSAFLANNLVPVTLGNVIGGVGVAALYLFAHGIK